MQEPVQGIEAVPDENNARYFHVVVAGPRDVSLLSSLLPSPRKTLVKFTRRQRQLSNARKKHTTHTEMVLE